MKSKLDRGAHSVYALQYHLVQCVKYRKQVFDNGGIIGLLKQKLWGEAFWSPSYFLATCGQVTLEQLKRYAVKNLGRIYQVVISHDRGKYYLSIVHEVPEKPYEDNGLYQAIDLGITKTVTAVNIQGKIFEAKNPRPDIYWNPQIDAIQSTRDHCKKGSKKWKHHHKMMGKKKMSKSKKATSGLNRSTQNNGYLSRFVRFLTYKAQLAGKKVIEIDERNTSKRCYVCGKEHDMPLWKRTMDCDCGNLIDRDRNSTISIMLRFLSQNAMWTGYQQFVDNLRKTGLLMPWSYPTGALGTLEIHSQEAPCKSLG